MAPTPPDNQPDGAAAPAVGAVKRYPVGQPDGSTRCQLVLIVAGPDENGAVRGWPLGYEDQAAQLRPEHFA